MKELDRLKICVFGDMGVGCTSLIIEFLNVNPEDLDRPVGNVHILKKSVFINNFNAEIIIFDLVGPRVRIPLFPMKPFFNDAKGGILVYDITNMDSFKGLKEWVKEFKKFCREVPIVLIGNKLDLENQRVVSKDAVRDIVQEYNILRYIETSAKMGKNVEQAFIAILREIIM
jgi:small GTP-binding protein